MKSIQETYNKDYYEYELGDSAYDRENHEWLDFFRNVAKQIVRDINPKTVLDVGCAKGFLVEALRDLGVEAYGIDISEYAISQVRDDIKPYCKVASAEEPLDRQYDLIVNIEVLEHIEKTLIPNIIANICKHTDKVIFSSTPSDFKEVTHINIQPIEYWVEKFYQNGFVRKLDYDADYIAPSTMLFTKSNEPISLTIKDYERNFHRVYNEKIELRNELSRVVDELNNNRGIVEPLKNINKEYERINKEYEVMHQQDLERIKDVEEKHQLLSELNQEIRKTNEEIIARNEELVNSNKELRNSNEELEDINQELNDIKLMLEDKHTNLKGISEQLQVDNEQLYRKVSELEQSNAELTSLSHERMLVINDIRGKNEVLANKVTIMENTKGWRMLNKLRRVRNFLLYIPRRSKKLVTLVGKFFVNWKTYGWKITVGKTKRYIKNGGQLIVSEELTIQEQLERQVYLIECTKEAKTFKYNPLISFIVPVFNTPTDVLKEMIECVQAQVYRNWELCLINASKDNQEVCQVLEEYSSKDKRIKVIVLDQNKGISGNSNVGLQNATGEFIALLDHDDLIVEEALFEVVKRLQEPNNEYDFFYSDKDMMSADGTKFYNPLYKPDWSLEMLYSANYITHFDVIRRSLMNEVGGFDSSTDGAQDWDMFLKIGEVARQVCHIPKVLYHWRMIETSAASGIEAKPYALDAQIRSINNHFKRTGIKAIANFLDRKLYIIKVDYELPTDYVISVVINDTGSDKQLQQIIHQVIKSSVKHCKMQIVVTTTKSELKLDYKEIEWCIVQDNNYAKNYNAALKLCKGKSIVFIDSQVEVNKDTIFELAQWTENNAIGIIGPKVINQKDIIDHIGIQYSENEMKFIGRGYINPTYNAWGYTEWYRNFDVISPQCFATSREWMEELKGFNEQQMNEAQIDLCLRSKKLGRRNLYTPFAITRIKA